MVGHVGWLPKRRSPEVTRLIHNVTMGVRILNTNLIAIAFVFIDSEWVTRLNEQQSAAINP